MHKPPIRILIAEDHLIARLGLAAIINTQQDMQIVAEASNGRQALDVYREYKPDVALMDVRMPVMNGFEAMSAIRAEFPEAHIVAISAFGGDQDIRRALRCGAQAYLIKDILEGDLIKAIRSVHAGRRYLTDLVRASLAPDPALPDLTSRELEVLNLIVQGLGNKQISYTLGIADYTVKNHVKNILTKLRVEDRTHAATVAIRRGIIHLY
jgi:two-component system NarL family response regulator